MAWAPTRLLIELWLRMAGFCITLFGPRWAYFWARVACALGWVILGRLRGVALRNVDLCLPEKPLAERTRIARAGFRHFCYTFVDYLLAPRYFQGQRGLAYMHGSDKDSPYIEWVAQGRAGFILAAHFGNWEVGTWNVNRFGFKPMIVIAKPIQPPLLNRWIVRARQTFGNEVHEHKGGARAYARALKEQRTVGILVDQNGGDFAPVETFFGVPCTWQADFVRLALRGEGRIAHAAMRRAGEAFAFEYLESQMHQYARDTEPMQVMRDYRDFLERVIRDNPEQYFWMHRRFKARKPGWGDAYADLGRRWGQAEREALIKSRA